MNEPTGQKPKISVLIPVYNEEKYLNQCLESVLRQPMRELEIICINDGSTDSTARILNEYAKKDSRIRAIHQTNQGFGNTLNNAIEASTGEYIHFLDADDYLTDNSYEELYQIAIEHRLDYLKIKSYAVDAQTERIITGSYADKLAQKSLEPVDYEKPFSFEKTPLKLTISPTVSQWDGIYQREFLIRNNIRFPPLQAFADHAFYYLVIARAQRIMGAKVYMIYHRINVKGSLVANHLYRFADFITSFSIISKKCRFLPQEAFAYIINAKLGSMLYWYNLSLAKGLNTKEVKELMRDFVNTFDFSQIDSVNEDASRYLDYMILKFGMDCEDGVSSVSERKAIVASAKKVHRNSRVVMYGAGKYGKIIYKLFRLSRFCKIVLWVDKEWESLIQSNLPVSCPNEILGIDFDCVFVAISDFMVASGVLDWLIKNGIAKDKIVSAVDR